MHHVRRRRLTIALAVALAATLAPAAALGGGNASAAPTAPLVPAAPSGPVDPTYRPLGDFVPTGSRVRVRPTSYAAVRIDLGDVRDELADAPPEGTASGIPVALPTPEGGTAEFVVSRTQVMQARLAAEHPEIRTYAGHLAGDPLTTLALDVTPMGLHAAVREPEGRAWYVDPAYDRRGTTEHLAFRGSATIDPTTEFVEREAPEIRTAVRAAARRAAAGARVVEKRYRLALTSDPSYADYFGTENVLAEKATLIARVNQIYGQDLGIRMLLVNDTDALNLDSAALATDRDGPCGANPCFRSADPDDPESFGDLDFCSGRTLARNRIVLGQLIGADDYDVGHIVLGKNGGGIAYLGVVGADYKGGGCTGLPEPKGDFFAIDYVAHELGHQFAGNHTFNGVQNACSGANRNGGTSVEPGSGSSVMAYAGICLQDDLQPHTDPYFSFRTLDEVNAYTGAALAPVVEVQNVSLRDFGDPGTSLTLGYQDAEPVTIGAEDYDAATLEAAVESLTGTDVTISGWGYDPFSRPRIYPAPLTRPGRGGFQVIFAGDARPDAPGDHADVPSLSVVGGGGASGFVAETARGGLADNGGSATEATTDRAPRITRITPRGSVPVRTPFRLEGAGRDADGDPLSYLWEQTDRGEDERGTALKRNRKVYGPLFRVFGTAARVSDEDTLESPSPGINLAGRSGVRFFPDLAQVMAGDTNAATGSCPPVPPLPTDPEDYEPVPPRTVACYSEFLPTGAYRGTPGLQAGVMHFRLTARDGRGGVASDRTRLRVADAGPFRVRSQRRDGLTYRAGQVIPVRWAVNGTRRLSSRVTIHLSLDGGRTWRRTLAGATLNDGAKDVRIPPRVAATGRARIVVAAARGSWYAMSGATVRIRR